MFFFKPKEIHIDCFVDDSGVYEYFPVDYSHKFFPEWWKKLPKEIKSEDEKKWPHGTMKRCVGFNLFYANSITIPLWTDILIDHDDKGHIVKYSDKTTTGGNHSINQMKGFIDPNEFVHLKINSPWFFKCKEDINWTWTESTWNFSKLDEIIIPPGIIDYKYQYGTNINLFFKLGKKILLECGQPMVNVRPLTERKVKLHTHLVSWEEKNKIAQLHRHISFSGKHNKIKEIIKKKESERKCPFHF